MGLQKHSGTTHCKTLTYVAKLSAEDCTNVLYDCMTVFKFSGKNRWQKRRWAGLQKHSGTNDHQTLSNAVSYLEGNSANVVEVQVLWQWMKKVSGIYRTF